MSKQMNRRQFLKTIGAAGIATVVIGGLEGCQSPASPTATTTLVSPTPTTPGSASSVTAPDAYIFFTEPESAFVEAAVARIIPKDDLGPGALEAGVSYFIDHQLAGGYGIYARHYTQGPWLAATPQQGYQMRYIPREIYRIGISEVNAYSMTTNQKTFDQLASAQQDDLLKGLEGGTIKLASMPAALFFTTMRNDTMDGFFADPIYGGNKGKVGWLLVGFPGVPTSYKDQITQFNVPYTGPTVSLVEAEMA
jgi:gluconate 2-dehydrogenase gamma chain